MAIMVDILKSRLDDFLKPAVQVQLLSFKLEGIQKILVAYIMQSVRSNHHILWSLWINKALLFLNKHNLQPLIISCFLNNSAVLPSSGFEMRFYSITVNCLNVGFLQWWSKV